MKRLSTILATLSLTAALMAEGGLPDWSTAVISNRFGITNATYFTRQGRLYMGEMFTDHDLMEDALERKWPEFGATPAKYDAHIDGNDDGWSNWAEIRARCHAQRAGEDWHGHPQPEVTMGILYGGAQDLSGGTLRVEAYGGTDRHGVPTVFSVPLGDFFRRKSLTFRVPEGVRLCEGQTTFVVSVGSVRGVATDSDVGWRKAGFEVELQGLDPACPCNAPSGTLPAGSNDASRVYVYRWAVDNTEPLYSSLEKTLILEKESHGEYYLNAGDFLSVTSFDLDWDLFQSEVMNDPTVRENRLPVTSVTYRVYAQLVDIGSQAHSNTVPFVEFRKNFEATSQRSVPVPVAPGDDAAIVYGARPTFRWRMASDTYTAFGIQVSDASGTTVWSSGKRAAPPRNSAGEYLHRATLYPGDQTSLGKVFANTNNYTWKVSMYNAKFQDDAWSTNRAFRVNVYGEDEPNNAGFHSLNAAVKYFGPGVLNGNAAQTNGTIRVEAYASPDFAGEPAGRAFVRDVAGVTNAAEAANARIVGLPAGTYYVRAFIDSDGDFRRSAWESWGYSRIPAEAGVEVAFDPMPVTVGDGIATPTAAVFIEDADTDQDSLPDVWEYDNAGADKADFLLRQGPPSHASDGYIAINPNLQATF